MIFQERKPILLRIVFCILGPVVSYLIAKYSVRSVTIAGGVIAFLGAVGGSLSPNLSVLIITYGVICGELSFNMTHNVFS